MGEGEKEQGMSATGTPVYVETFTGASIDGARIATSTAQILVSLDQTLPADVRAQILDALDEGLTWLHAARELMPSENATSVHIVRPPEGLIITP